MQFDDMTVEQLQTMRDQIDAALKNAVLNTRKAALAAANDASKAHGFTLAELTGAKIAKVAGGKNPPKYANPADPAMTWSGRGRRPDWVNAAIAAGTALEVMAI